jgi:protein-tyrosine phosphatase
MLYTIMMTTAPRRIASVLQACAKESARGPVIFHCQKGKDRTGVIAMLLQSCLGASDEEILEAYGASGDLLGGEESSSAAAESSEDPDGASKSDSGMIDWSHFRGSPSSAMADTLEWTRRRHGSMENYLEFASFGKEQQTKLKQTLLQIGDQQPL